MNKNTDTRLMEIINVLQECADRLAKADELLGIKGNSNSTWDDKLEKFQHIRSLVNGVDNITQQVEASENLDKEQHSHYIDSGVLSIHKFIRDEYPGLDRK